MTSIDIYSILSSKPNNNHYLQRYYKFILNCNIKNEQFTGYTERHHICPKSSDLFPEYKDLKIFKWNVVNLTDRQHYIAHWMLWKAFAGKQTFAFFAMANNQTPKQLKRNVRVLNSKTFEQLKTDYRNMSSKLNKGYASYFDSVTGVKLRCKTNDPNVLSGIYISLTTGRKMPAKTDEYKLAVGVRIRNLNWSKNPTRVVNLYFLDMKISLICSRGFPELIPFLDQGWGYKITKEYKSMLAVKVNKNMSRTARLKAGENISKTRKSKLYTPRVVTKESRLKLRTNPLTYILFYDTISCKFLEFDSIDAETLDTTQFIRVFGRTGVKVWNNDGKTRKVNKLVPMPEGWFVKDQLSTIEVFDIQSKSFVFIIKRDLDITNHVIMTCRNENRIKIYRDDGLSNRYVHKAFLETYGMPYGWH